MNGSFRESSTFRTVLVCIVLMTIIVGIANGMPNYIIMASVGLGGSVSPSGTVSVPPGVDQTFTITPDYGYQIAEVIVDGISLGKVSSYTFTNVQANHQITATFTRYTIIMASAGPEGSISPSGTVLVTQGGSQTFTITPDSGYQIDAVIVDGISQGKVSSYTFTNVQDNHQITATFIVVSSLSGSGLPGKSQYLKDLTGGGSGLSGKSQYLNELIKNGGA